jgi:hypothetical protein
MYDLPPPTLGRLLKALFDLVGDGLRIAFEKARCKTFDVDVFRNMQGCISVIVISTPNALECAVQ